MPAETYYAGLDIGGSTIKAVLVDSDAKQQGDMVEVPSHVKNGFSATINQLELALTKLRSLGFSGGAFPFAIAHLGGKGLHASQDFVNLGHDVLAVDENGFRRAVT